MSVLIIVGIGLAVCGILFALLLAWERIRTNQERIRETKLEVYESELGGTFTDEAAYFRIFGWEFGPFPIVSAHARRVDGPCFVRCVGIGINDKKLKSYLAFRLTGYVP